MTTILKPILSLLAALTLAIVPALAMADVSATAGVNANVTAAGVSASTTAAAHLSVVMQRQQTRAGQEIDRRVTSLQDLLTRTGEIKNLTDQDKASIATAINTQITALTALKVKIAADTDEATLKTDLESITSSYRIYALVLPQIRIIAAADRVVTISKELQAIGAKLQARIQAAASAGADMTAANASLTAYATKLGDAQTQAQAAVTEIAGLVPDNGDATVMASNTAALKDARTKIQAAQQDIVAARKDAETIRKAVKGYPLTASSTTSASSTTTTN